MAVQFRRATSAVLSVKEVTVTVQVASSRVIVHLPAQSYTRRDDGDDESTHIFPFALELGGNYWSTQNKSMRRFVVLL